MSVAHDTAVTFAGGRYPYKPTCSCGWTTNWGYVSEHAARCVADDHEEHHAMHDTCPCCGRTIPGRAFQQIHLDCWSEHHSDPSGPWPRDHSCNLGAVDA